MTPAQAGATGMRLLSSSPSSSNPDPEALHQGFKPQQIALGKQLELPAVAVSAQIAEGRGVGVCHDGIVG
jgi:hypothetical protein